MAPRKDENDEVSFKNDVPSSPNSYVRERNQFKTLLSFDSLDLTESFDSTTDNTSLRESLLHLSVKGSDLLDEVNDQMKSSAFSPTLEACQSSLVSDTNSLLSEAKVLLENLGTEGSMTTSWRASLAQIRVDSYLENIQNAIYHPSRERLDMELSSIADSLSALALDKNRAKGQPIAISSWKSPSLAFNVIVGTPITYNHVGRDDSLSLKLTITAIAEVLAIDLDSGIIGSYQACIIGVENCNHESRNFCAETGSAGDCLVTVKLSPMGRKNLQKKTWGIDEEVGHLHVKAART